MYGLASHAPQAFPALQFGHVVLQDLEHLVLVLIPALGLEDRDACVWI